MEPISGETATAGPLNQNSKVFQNMSAHKSRMRKSLSRLLLLDNTSSLGLRQIDSRSLKNEGKSSGRVFAVFLVLRAGRVALQSASVGLDFRQFSTRVHDLGIAFSANLALRRTF
jgi:hypothetical protein